MLTSIYTPEQGVWQQRHKGKDPQRSSFILFKPNDYVVRFTNFSENEEDQMPLFMVDYASLGKHVREEKLLDCLDLLEMMADPQFIYNLCVQEGRLQYMLPACKSIYADLSKPDPLYKALFRMLLSEENGVFRYGARFYEDFYNKGDAPLNRLKESDHWLSSIRDLN